MLGSTEEIVPTVTAIIPVYNGARFIGDAIESVLSQTFPSIECIVVDDGSTDETSSVVAAFGGRVRCVRKPNGGVASARNRGVREATGRFVAFLDADDVWLHDKIERQVALAEATGAALVYTGLRIVDEGLEPLFDQYAPDPSEALRNSLLLEQPYMSIPSTALVRKDVFSVIGGFDERLSTSADTDFGCRVALDHPIEAIAEPLVLYRTHAAQMHHDASAMEHDMLLVYEKFFTEGLAPPWLRRLEGRARANLHFTLAAYARRSSPVVSFRHLGRALRADPMRTLSLLRSGFQRC